VTSNLTEWNAFYDGARRQANCDLQFLTLLYRYALKEKDVATCLVIGAGDGVEAFEISTNGIRVTATDFSEVSVMRMKAFAHADKNPLIDARQLDQRKIGDLGKEQFDLVVSWSTLSYISYAEAKQVVADVRGVLTPGGVFIVLFEDFASHLRSQPGAVETGHQQYRLPSSSVVNPDLEMTFFKEDDIENEFTDGYRILAKCSRTIQIPPKATFDIAQRMYVLQANQ
jgi:2-polyprenyl-3-methyl-5-hydroxy-6-metoxy-1,4-benzoquinol methylase